MKLVDDTGNKVRFLDLPENNTFMYRGNAYAKIPRRAVSGAPLREINALNLTFGVGDQGTHCACFDGTELVEPAEFEIRRVK